MRFAIVFLVTANVRITGVLQRASLERKCAADLKKRAVTRPVDPFVRAHFENSQSDKARLLAPRN